MRSCFGLSSSTVGTKSGSARSSFSGLNLFSKPVSAATKWTRYVPLAFSGTVADSRPSSSFANGIVLLFLPCSNRNSALFIT